MAIGPVQLIVLGFTDSDFHGRVIADVERRYEPDKMFDGESSVLSLRRWAIQLPVARHMQPGACTTAVPTRSCHPSGPRIRFTNSLVDRAKRLSRSQP
jgi:hypothetical protein